MCGIACILDLQSDPLALRERAIAMARLVRHRGPDWSGLYADDHAVLAHERLSIVDVEHGAQPLTDAANNLVLAANGEIYNHKALRTALEGYPFKTASDCEVIIPLYERHGPDFLNRMSGIFSFVLYDRRNQDYLIARDPVGVIPLYTGRDEHGNLYVASEMKALIKHCQQIEDFPPGHYLTRQTPEPVRYYHPQWTDFSVAEKKVLDLGELRSSLESAVHQ